MIEIQNLSKTFTTSDGTVEALKNITLTIPDGEIYGIIGMSGAGKSTLVRSINLLEHPTEGRILIDGTDLTQLSEPELRAARRNITMIFQGFNLLMQRNCQKNVCFPMELAGVKRSEAMKRAAELLELVGLPESRLPESPSPAEVQRALAAEAVAIRERLPKGGAVIALCIEGKPCPSVELSRRMEELAVAGKTQLTFLIGGSVGLDESLKRQADWRLSMSPMTFPHHLARIMLLEQIYRAYQISAGTKYHK